MEIQIAKLAKKKISDVHIPIDLILEILIVLPIEALVKFLCVSKEFATMIRSRDFMNSYLIKSLSHPGSLFFTFRDDMFEHYFFFSARDPINRGSSIATYHMKCDFCPYGTISPSVHGLISHGPPSKLMVYNPSTRKTFALPKFTVYTIFRHTYIGYDPVSGDYKVLCITAPYNGLVEKFRVLKLENGTSWRDIQDFPSHYINSLKSPDACVDGILYYSAYLDEKITHAVMSFDVRSEKFDLIKAPDGAKKPKLTTYEGKLAILDLGHPHQSFRLCVLENAAKHEWSNKLYVLPPIFNWRGFEPFCATHAGEIVFACGNEKCEDILYVRFFDPKRNTLRRVRIEVEGITEPLRLTSIFSGQVDNLMFL